MPRQHSKLLKLCIRIILEFKAQICDKYMKQYDFFCKEHVYMQDHNESCYKSQIYWHIMKDAHGVVRLTEAVL